MVRESFLEAGKSVVGRTLSQCLTPRKGEVKMAKDEATFVHKYKYIAHANAETCQ